MSKQTKTLKPLKSTIIFNRWLQINKIQLLIHYRNYLTELLGETAILKNNTHDNKELEHTVNFKKFALDMLIADTIDAQNHRTTLLFDPIPIIQGKITNEKDLIIYIQSI